MNLLFASVSGSGIRGPGSESCSDHNVRHANPSVGAAVSARLAKSLAALLPEHTDLRAASFSVDDSDDLGIGHEWCASQHLAAVLFQEQHLVERDFLADFGIDAVDRDHGAGIDFDLAPAGLNDCEHDSASEQPLRTGLCASV